MDEVKDKFGGAHDSTKAAFDELCTMVENFVVSQSLLLLSKPLI